MSNNIEIVATGNVVNDPVYFEKKENCKSMVSFCFASTPRPSLRPRGQEMG